MGWIQLMYILPWAIQELRSCLHQMIVWSESSQNLYRTLLVKHREKHNSGHFAGCLITHLRNKDFTGTLTHMLTVEFRLKGATRHLSPNKQRSCLCLVPNR